MIAKNPLFTSQTKVADMLDQDHYLTDVLSRLGVSLGFGESTLGETAEQCGLDPDTLCLICNVYTFDRYEPDAITLSRGHITDVVKYIRNSHRSYLTTELVWLERAIDKLIVPFNEKQKTVIWRFFNGYKD